jgi:PAS domain S-box-containing protein
MPELTPRPFLVALQRALERTPLPAGDRAEVVKALVPYAYAYEALVQLFEQSSELLVLSGVDGRFRRVNPAFERALGWTAEELTSRAFFDFVHPADLEITRSKLEKLKAGLDVLRFENRYKAKDGSWVRLAWTCPAPPEGNKELIALARVVAEVPRNTRTRRSSTPSKS